MEAVQTRSNKIALLLGLALLMLVGFVLRYSYLERMILHADEFLSMLLIKMILESGVPVLPTGIFHGKGLVFNYPGAALAAIFSYSIETIRWQSLVFSLISIPLFYWLTLKLYTNRQLALFAAAVLSLLPEAILWGGRARMYSLAQLMLLLVILLAWYSLFWVKDKRLYLLALPVAILAMLLSHLVTIVIIPSLLLALGIVHYGLNKPDKKVWGWLLGVGCLTLAATALGYWLGREPGEMRQWQEEASLTANLSRAIFDARLLANFRNYFFLADNVVLTVFALLGLVRLGQKIGQRSLSRVDWAGCFINIQLWTIFLGLYLIIPSDIRDERHNFVVLTPYLILAAAYGALLISSTLQQRWPTARGLPVAFYGLALLGVVALQWPTLDRLLIEDDPETYRYDLAMALVQKQMAAGDQLFSVWPPPAYIAGRPVDYYANQHKPRFIQEPTTGRLVDYHTGGQYLATVEDFYEAIQAPGRLWFVTDDKRLTRNFSKHFSQEILNQMSLTSRVENMLIFREKDAPWPLATSPAIAVDAEFKNQLRLTGYSTQLVGTDLRLTLFWHPLEPIFNYKVFVHLRDQQGNTVAQADFAPYDHVIDISQWGVVWDDDTPFPSGTVLHLPPELLSTNPDQYRLYVGLYVEELNLERVPLVDDVSGENAVILTDLGF